MDKEKAKELDEHIDETLRVYDDHVLAMQGIKLAELAGLVEAGIITQEQLEQRMYEQRQP